MINKIVPFLSKYLPPALAIKGMSKANPKLAGFLTDAATAGYTADSILDFIRDKIEPEGVKSEKQRLQAGASQGTLRPDEMSNLQKMSHQGFSKAIPAGLGLAAGAISNFGGQGDIQQQEQPQQQNQAPNDRNIIEQYDPELFLYLIEKIKKGVPLLQAATDALGHSRFNKAIKQMTSDHKSDWISILQSIFGQEGQSQPQKGQTQQQPQQQAEGPGSQKLMAILQQLQQRRGQG